jgi:signal transduction histidine kinase
VRRSPFGELASGRVRLPGGDRRGGGPRAAETEARLALAEGNAELVAARAILASHTRADARERIARELHDALGHTLTALGLQLEIA